MTFREKYEQVKTHVKEHKTEYIIAAGSSAATAVVMLVVMRRPVNVTEIANTVAPVISPVFEPVFNNENVVNNGGYARKIIRCLETDELWPSMSKAAEDAGYNLQRMSDHIHGRTDHLDGLHYVIEAVAA